MTEQKQDRRERPDPERATPVANQANRAADQHDATFHDPVHYQGEIVEYVKDIGPPDPEYKGDVQQVQIVTRDGTAKVVLKADILRDSTPAVTQTFAPDRVPGGPLHATEAKQKAKEAKEAKQQQP